MPEVLHLNDLKQMKAIGANGVMIGAALYTNKIKLEEAVTMYERGGQGEI